MERICPSCGFRTVGAFCGHDGERTRIPDGAVFEGRYRIDGFIAGGSQGEVYRARHHLLGDPVAIKILVDFGPHESQETRRRRFVREARLIRRIVHPNVLRFHDVGEAADGSLYLVTELLDGEPLSARLERDIRLDLDAAAEIARQVLAALAEAHERGIVHRDIKPENLFLVGSPGAGTQVKVLDFGIAKAVGRDADGSSLTQESVAVGTVAYMAPEQIRAGAVSGRTDLYALGCVLYELLQGEPPFVGDPLQVLQQHLLQITAPPCHPDGRSMTGPLVDLVMACLQKDPAKRPADARAALACLAAPPRARAIVRRPAAVGRPPVSPRRSRSRPSAPTAPEPAEPEPEAARPGPRGRVTTDEWMAAAPAETPPAGRARMPWVVAVLAVAVAAVWGVVLARSGAGVPLTLPSAQLAPAVRASPRAPAPDSPPSPDVASGRCEPARPR